jgi:hypothetical protein
MDVIYALKIVWGGFMGCMGEGKIVLEEKKRDGFVGFDREKEREERFGGEGGMEDCGKKKEDGGKRNGANLDLIVYGRIYGFICKMFTWHFLIGGCKTGFYTSSLLNLIS